MEVAGSTTRVYAIVYAIPPNPLFKEANMNKITEMLKEGNYAAAATALEGQANSFTFGRDVLGIVEELEKECRDEAILFTSSLVAAAAQRYPDGRCETSVGWCNELNPKDLLAEADLRVSSDVKGSSVLAYNELMRKVVRNSMHPTVMQQALQIAFLFLQRNQLVPESFIEAHVKNEYGQEKDRWWRMPLI